MMAGSKPHGLQRIACGKAEVDVVEHGLQCSLVLSVSSGHADSQHGFSRFEDQRWRESDPRSLAGNDAIRMAFPGIEALEPRAQPDAGFARLHAAPTARSGHDDVAPAVGRRAGRRVMYGP